MVTYIHIHTSFTQTAHFKFLFLALFLSFFVVCLFQHFSIFLHKHIHSLFNSFVSSCASSRAPPYLLAHRRYLSLRADVQSYWRRHFRDRCNEIGRIASKKRRASLFLSQILGCCYLGSFRTKALTHLPGGRWCQIFCRLCARAHILKRKKHLHVPSILALQATSPINADTGAHYTTSPSYANYEPPWKLHVRLFRIRPYTHSREAARASKEREQRARAHVGAKEATKGKKIKKKNNNEENAYIYARARTRAHSRA